MGDGKYLYVLTVKDGPIKKYNDEKKDELDLQVRPMDFIIEVNDVEGDSALMLQELKTKTAFEIVVRHAEEISVAIEKKNAKEKLGLDLNMKTKGKAVLISKVNEGPFKKWNENNEKHKVCDGDRIVSVGYSGGDAKGLESKMQKAKSFHAVLAPSRQGNVPLGVLVSRGKYGLLLSG